MSHTLHPLRRARLQRSELAVPGSNPEFIQKAAVSAADYVFLDLEDAVAPSEKEQARKNVVAALQDIDWRALGKTVSVRINGLDTGYMYRDVIDVISYVPPLTMTNRPQSLSPRPVKPRHVSRPVLVSSTAATPTGPATFGTITLWGDPVIFHVPVAFASVLTKA